MSEREEIYLEETEEEECICIKTEEQHQIILNLEDQVKKLLKIDLDREKVYMAALETYGEEAQIIMVFEEKAELQKELCKYLRGERNITNIAEEIADVEITLEQMKLLFEIDGLVDDFKSIKIDRLKERLK